MMQSGKQFHLSLGASIFAFAMSLVLFATALTAAILRHRALKKAAARLARPDAPHRAALKGDTVAALRQVPLFKDLPLVDLNALAHGLKAVQFGMGQEVFREDDPADALYIVLSGELEVIKRRVPPATGTDIINQLGAGDCFGEIAILENTLRTATVRAVQPCRLLKLPSADFHRLVVNTVGINRVREVLQNAVFLNRLIFLAGWPSEAIVRFAQRCHHVSYDANEFVMKRGRPNRNFYLIYDGTFEVRSEGNVLRRMRPGDYFGEISLLENGTATADIVALEESRCLVLERSDFLDFFAKDFHIGLHIEALAEERLGSSLFAAT